jgi:heptosyltransferase-1
VRRVDGIGQVIDCPLRRWRERWWTSATRREWRAFKQRLRQETYDAVIDLQGLTKSALVARLARGRSYGIANRTEGSSHEAPARWLVDLAITLPTRIHALDRSRQLVSRVLGTPAQEPPRFGLSSTRPKLDHQTMVFVHGSSREDKLWPETRWVALGRRFVEAGWHIALPHGNELELVRAERLAAEIDSEVTAFLDTSMGAGAAVQVWPRLRIDALVDRLAQTHGVIGLDSGVSHIAVALGLPHLQLYLHPTAWRTGPQPAHGLRYQRSIGGETTPTVDEVWAGWQRIEARARGE